MAEFWFEITSIIKENLTQPFFCNYRFTWLNFLDSLVQKTSLTIYLAISDIALFYLRNFDLLNSMEGIGMIMRFLLVK